MEKTLHPDKHNIRQYVWQELTEEQEMAIGEHIADCPQCAEYAQQEARFQYLWENWQAEKHGGIYWKKQIAEILKQSSQQENSFYRKERLNRWITDWKGKLGSMVQFIKQGKDSLVKIITDFPEDLFIAGRKFQFTQAAPVRGTGLQETMVKLQADREFGIQVLYDKTQNSLSVKIPKGDYDPPIVILMPRKGDPIMALAEEVEGTAFYAVNFPIIPVGGFSLLFEPIITD
jgi:hypothetical protein